MPRPPDGSRRAELVAALVDSLAADGIGRRSLRELAARIGTSHRMLLHHFGSREGLWVAVVAEVEARQRAIDAEVSGAAGDRLRATWDRVSDPAWRDAERLFFEVYARSAADEAPFDGFARTAVTEWLDGLDGDPAEARLALAMIRGLLLDLVATDDRAGTTAALEVGIRLFERHGGPVSR